MRLPDLPPAITARVVPVGYAQIALLLYGTDDTGATKRISGWRRSDPDFPEALSSGRSPTFDVTDIWQWLGRRTRSNDSRVQNSLRDMTKLQPNAPGAAAERQWLLSGLALRYETGDLGARNWMTALAALRSLVDDRTSRVPLEWASQLPDPPTARRLLAAAADRQLPAMGFVQQLVQALPMQSAVARRSDVPPNPLAMLAEPAVPDDLRALAAQSVMEVPTHRLGALAELTLAGDEGSLSSHLDATSTSPEAAGFIVQFVDRLAMTLGRRWSSVYDPACGEGHLLSALANAVEGRPWSVYGQDADAEALQLATARLLTTGSRFDLRLTDDTLEHDRLAGTRVDVVVADPPQPMRRQRIHQHMDAWWQHIVAKLADKDSMAFVLTSDLPEAQPSDEVIASGHVLAVIETGQRLRRDTPGRSVLWVLAGHRVRRAVHVVAPHDSSSVYQWPGTVLNEVPEHIAAVLADRPIVVDDDDEDDDEDGDGDRDDEKTPRLEVTSVVSNDPDQLRPQGAERRTLSRKQKQAAAEPDHFSDIARHSLAAFAPLRRASAVEQPSTLPMLRRRLLEALSELPAERREFEVMALMENLASLRSNLGTRDRG